MDVILMEIKKFNLEADGTIDFLVITNDGLRYKY